MEGGRAFLEHVSLGTDHCCLVADHKMSPVLQEAPVSILDLSLCNSTQWYRGRIRSTNVCAGYPEGNIDTCQVTVCGVPGPPCTPLFWIPELHSLVTLFLVLCLQPQ